MEQTRLGRVRSLYRSIDKKNGFKNYDRIALLTNEIDQINLLKIPFMAAKFGHFDDKPTYVFLVVIENMYFI